MRLKLLSSILVILLLTTPIYYALDYLSLHTNTSLFYFPTAIINSYQHPTLTPDFNFVILGLDPRNDSLEKTETTDTIILARLTNNAKINIISIPRDLWVYSLNTKINQIYPLSLATPDKFKYIQAEYSKLSGQNISKTMVITTKNLIDLTEIVGGVDVTLEEGFIDDQYPNPEYIKHPSSKIPMYKTVKFDQGNIHLDKNNITEFVRSLKSVTGGTDLGRIQRQQLLLEALLHKLKTPTFYKNFNNFTNLYKFYKTEVTTNISDSDLISLGIAMYPKISSLSINKSNIPDTVIYHPLKFINKQWVFIPQDKEYQSFQQYIGTALSF